MRRVLWVLLGALLGFQIAAPAWAARHVVVHRGPRHRTAVVVERGWPLRHPIRQVVIHPARIVVRVRPATYLAPMVFAGTIAATAPPRPVLVWEDGEAFDQDEGWSEFTLNCDSRGKKLWCEVTSGRIQFDWVEVIFDNGDAQVVDFAEKTYGAGLYGLLDFRDGRKVDHVRGVARAKSPEARLVLRMEK